MHISFLLKVKLDIVDFGSSMDALNSSDFGNHFFICRFGCKMATKSSSMILPHLTTFERFSTILPVVEICGPPHIIGLCRYHVFLQLKKDILDGRLVPPLKSAAVLASYAAQCE